MSRRARLPNGTASLFEAVDDQPWQPVDQAARDYAVSEGVAQTVFIEAGAGSGKTRTIVDRIVNLVAVHDVPLPSIAAITFTEAAAAELRDRLRRAFDDRLGHPSDGQRCREALDHFDVTAISTLHSFAQRVLSEHSVEAAVPPRFDVLDEVQSTLAFEDRWREWVDAQLADESAFELIERSDAIGIQLTRRAGASLKDLARIFNANWDRLEGVLTDAAPPALPPADLTSLRSSASAVLDVTAGCIDPGDKLLTFIEERRAKFERLSKVDDPLVAIDLVQSERKWTTAYGRKASWRDIDTAKGALRRFDEAAAELIDAEADAVLAQWRWRVAAFTLAAAEARRAEGTLEFHDLLVLARRLVRRAPAARSALHERYPYLLIDEFQDTDPIQVELATLIATDTVDVADEPWTALSVPAGRLCFVGDPQQSIYRFRRADIELFAAAAGHFGTAGQRLSLVQNFRTVPPVLDWVNDVFAAVMSESPHQAHYQPLVAARREAPGVDHRVRLIGGPHDDELNAEALREREAADVARLIEQTQRVPEEWMVEDAAGWRPARYDDIVVLVPSRLSLPALEHALRAAEIPYRAEASAIVFDTQHVREALTLLQAIDDPNDEIATVASLRTALFGCGDDDLVEYLDAGGRWDYRQPAPPSLPADHPVVEAMAYLRVVHDDRLWREPSELLERVLRERRAFELALLQRRPRDVWRQLRFLVEQARQFSESGGGGLRQFLWWADMQRREGARVHEPLLPEDDDHSVRIMTVHSAKGLEFPITIVSGLTTAATGRRGGVAVRWPSAHRMPEVALSRNATAGFEVLNEFEGEMDHHEKVRLLYVACTRARDHLVVSAHHRANKRGSLAALVWDHSQPVLGRSCRVVPDDDTAPAPQRRLLLEPAPADTLAARAGWSQARDTVLRTRPSIVSATAVAAGLASERDNAVGADAETLVAGTLRRGRAGTAFGRAVHGVLQVAALGSGADVDGLARLHAAAEGIPAMAPLVARAADAARRSPVVQRALAAPRRWRELYVAAPSDGTAVEGYVDLLFEDGDGLVVVDYKTDQVDGALGIDEAVQRYAPQAATYAYALERVTGRAVTECVFVFTGRGDAIERSVSGAALDSARAAVREWLRRA